MLTPVDLMLISGITFGISALLLTINFAMMWGKFLPSRPQIFGHIIFGLLTAVSGVTCVGGFVWFLLQQYAHHP